MVKPVYNEKVMARGDRSAPVRPGDVLADKYRVERILGSGGILAKHLDLGAPVAIKCLLPEVLDDETSSPASRARHARCSGSAASTSRV